MRASCRRSAFTPRSPSAAAATRTRARRERRGPRPPLVLYGLVGPYPPACRVLTSWLEQWELDFHRRFDHTERNTLVAIRSLLAELEERLVAFERPEADAGEAWFTNLTSERWAVRVEQLVARA